MRRGKSTNRILGLLVMALPCTVTACFFPAETLSAPQDEGVGGDTGVEVVCGDMRVSEAEACDDGNVKDGDACSSDCRCSTGMLADQAAAYSSQNGSCYVWIKIAEPWSIAAATCQKLSAMRLAAVTTQEELNFINSIDGFSADHRWIGGLRSPASMNAWMWENGEPWEINPCTVSGSPACNEQIDLWESDEPSGGDDCIWIDKDSKGFDDHSCQELRSFLCERVTP